MALPIKKNLPKKSQDTAAFRAFSNCSSASKASAFAPCRGRGDVAGAKRVVVSQG